MSEARGRHPRFRGNWEDLQQFESLASTPIRTEVRDDALRAWEQYKAKRQFARWGGKPPRKKGAHMDALISRTIDLSGADLDEICIGYVDLRGAILDECSLRGAWLKGANLENASLRHVDMSQVPGSGRGAARLLSAVLRGADLSGAILRGVDFSFASLNDCILVGADLSEANLSHVSLVRANLEGAGLTECRVYGISVWDAILKDAKQNSLIITGEDESTFMVDQLEVAQFTYLLLKHERLRDVLNAVTQKGVLLLGRFSGGGLDLLRALAEELRQLHYLPFIFDFERPADRDYTETIKTLVGLSRFVVVELSGPSVPQELYATVPHFKIPFVPILKKGSKPFATFADLLEYPWVLSPVEYEDKESLLPLVSSRIIDPAENRAKARHEDLKRIFNR